MPVIPFPQRRRHREPAPLLPPNRESRINGTFPSPIGRGSRRKTAPAEIVRGLRGVTAVIGPVDVDLLGLTVSVPAFTIDTGPRLRGSSRSLPQAPRRAGLEAQMGTGA